VRPKFELSRLRDIGWRNWDPIGLKDLEGNADDEYDSYLLQAIGMLWNGTGPEEVAAYLVWAEIEYMGLAKGHQSGERAKATVEALDAYAAELRRSLKGEPL